MVNLDLLLKAINAIASPAIRDKIQRNETVIKLLKQFNLDPEHPQADFSDIYAYTLVEYGINNLNKKPFLQLFRHEEIKQAFRKAFDHNNPSILLAEVDAFVTAYALGDEIKALRIDIRREIAAFYIVFSQVAKRSRKPADTLMSQQIDSLRKVILNIQEQIERQPTLEGMRTEIARLATSEEWGREEQRVAGVPPVVATAGREGEGGKFLTVSSSSASPILVALAQQMRGWFETLGYQLEKHEVWAENYFEFIINIPVRRSFDRILVRGIAGEVSLSDVMALRTSVEEQKTDEGWLVTTRRISRAARDEVKKEENRHLDCYTFDELIDLNADFSGYIDWLEAEIDRRQVDRKYVPLACSKEELDPASQRPIGVSRYAEEDGWIDGYIDLWLDDPAKEHISILGEFGTGKTWFAFHYAWVALQRYKDAQKRGVERPRLPLVITLRDFARALNVENVLAGFFFTQHNIRINSDVFDQLNRMGKLLLIFDGFDEMAAKVDKQQMINNFWELAKVVVPGAKVILTCRTEHFPEAQEGRALLNAELQASTKQLTGETPQFEVLELEKFSDAQIRQVLSFQAEPATVDRIMENPQLLDLARRPVMSELILEALPDIEAGKPVDMARVYLYAVRRKMERDIKSDRTFTSLADKLYFLCELSWEMLSTDEMSLNYKLFPDRIRRLFGVTEKDLDHWHYDMLAQTMLIRNANGDYTPAHRSLLEFFVAYKFAAELGVLAGDFIDVARAQSCLDENGEPVDYTWSGYFSRQFDTIKAPLREFVSESLEVLRESFGRSQLTKAVLDLLVPMVDGEKLEGIIQVIEGTRERSEEDVGYVGGNAATLAVRIDKAALEGRDFNFACIKGSELNNASLRGTNFQQANLANSIFTKTFGTALSVVFSPNGKLLATGGDDGIIRLWELASGKEISTFTGHTNSVRSVSFNPKGTLLASGSYDQTIKVWDVQSGECLYTLLGHTDIVYSVVFSPDGERIASGSDDYTIKLWNYINSECLITLSGHKNRVRSIAFSPDGKRIVSGSSDRTLIIWDILTQRPLNILEGHSRWLRSVSVNSDGRMIASSSDDGTVIIWDANTGEYLKTLYGHANRVRSVIFSPDSRLLASGGDDNMVKIWDAITGECLTTLNGHINWVRSLSFSPNSKLLVTSSDDLTVKIWDIQTYQCLNTLQGHSGLIHSLAFSPDAKNLVSSGNNEQIKLWDVSNGNLLKILHQHTNWVRSISFSPDGKTLASCSGDQTVKLWDIQTGECLKTLYGHTNQIMSVTFSPDGKIIASGGSDYRVRLWDTNSGECNNTIRAHDGWVRAISFSSDGKRFVTGGDDEVIKLWDINTGECIRIFEGHKGWVGSVSWSPDGKIVASCSNDKTVKLWDIKTGTCTLTLQGHTNWVKAVVFSNDGKVVASGGNDKTVKIWDVSTGKILKTLQHSYEVRALAFSSATQILASSGSNETINIWDIETEKCLKALRDRPYENMNITGVKGLTNAEISTLKALGAVEDREM